MGVNGLFLKKPINVSGSYGIHCCCCWMGLQVAADNLREKVDETLKEDEKVRYDKS